MQVLFGRPDLPPGRASRGPRSPRRPVRTFPSAEVLNILYPTGADFRRRREVRRMLRNLEWKGYLDIAVPGSGKASMIYVNDAPADFLEGRNAEKMQRSLEATAA